MQVTRFACMQKSITTEGGANSTKCNGGSLACRQQQSVHSVHGRAAHPVQAGRDQNEWHDAGQWDLRTQHDDGEGWARLSSPTYHSRAGPLGCPTEWIQLPGDEVNALIGLQAVQHHQIWSNQRPDERIASKMILGGVHQGFAPL